MYIVYTGIIHEATYRMEHVACDRKPRDFLSYMLLATCCMQQSCTVYEGNQIMREGERVKKKMERDRGNATEWERKREGEKGRKRGKEGRGGKGGMKKNEQLTLLSFSATRTNTKLATRKLYPNTTSMPM